MQRFGIRSVTGSGVIGKLLVQPSTNSSRSKLKDKQLICCIDADVLPCQSWVVNVSFGRLKHVHAHLLCKSFADLNGFMQLPHDLWGVCLLYTGATVAIYGRWCGSIMLTSSAGMGTKHLPAVQVSILLPCHLPYVEVLGGLT